MKKDILKDYASLWKYIFTDMSVALLLSPIFFYLASPVQITIFYIVVLVQCCSEIMFLGLRQLQNLGNKNKSGENMKDSMLMDNIYFKLAHDHMKRIPPGILTLYKLISGVLLEVFVSSLVASLLAAFVQMSFPALFGGLSLSLLFFSSYWIMIIGICGFYGNQVERTIKKVSITTCVAIFFATTLILLNYTVLGSIIRYNSFTFFSFPVAFLFCAVNFFLATNNLTKLMEERLRSKPTRRGTVYSMFDLLVLRLIGLFVVFIFGEVISHSVLANMGDVMKQCPQYSFLGIDEFAASLFCAAKTKGMLFYVTFVGVYLVIPVGFVIKRTHHSLVAYIKSFAEHYRRYYCKGNEKLYLTIFAVLSTIFLLQQRTSTMFWFIVLTAFTIFEYGLNIFRFIDINNENTTSKRWAPMLLKSWILIQIGIAAYCATFIGSKGVELTIKRLLS